MLHIHENKSEKPIKFRKNCYKTRQLNEAEILSAYKCHICVPHIFSHATAKYLKLDKYGLN